MASDDSERYQGWKNRETWAAGLWLMNTEPVYNAARAIAALCKLDGKLWAERMAEQYQESPREWDGEQAARNAFAEQLDIPELLREYLTDPRDGTPESALEDIGSLWRIDYGELYDALTED